MKGALGLAEAKLTIPTTARVVRPPQRPQRRFLGVFGASMVKTVPQMQKPPLAWGLLLLQYNN